MKFDVFGRQIEVIRENGVWVVFILGEGKKRKSDIVIPAETNAEDIAEFLSDLFHESATPERPTVRVIG